MKPNKPLMTSKPHNFFIFFIFWHFSTFSNLKFFTSVMGKKKGSLLWFLVLYIELLISSLRFPTPYQCIKFYFILQFNFFMIKTGCVQFTISTSNWIISFYFSYIIPDCKSKSQSISSSISNMPQVLTLQKSPQEKTNIKQIYQIIHERFKKRTQLSI